MSNGPRTCRIGPGFVAWHGSGDLTERTRSEGYDGSLFLLTFRERRRALGKRRILLIDDSEIALAMEQAVLERRGYEIRATATFAEFETTLRVWRPDLILVDIRMPDARGTDLCRALKSDLDTRDIPVVLFSSLPDAELASLAEAVGADGFLSKQNGLDALAATIDQLVESIVW
jgi:CheY-like chemotaxis protein